MQRVAKATEREHQVLVKNGPRARLSEKEINLIRGLVGSLRARGLQPMDVYREIAEGLRQRSLSR